MNPIYKLDVNKHYLVNEIEAALKTYGIDTGTADNYWLVDIDNEYISRYNLDILGKSRNVTIVWKDMFNEAYRMASLDHIHNYVDDSIMPPYISINVSESASRYRDMFSSDTIIVGHSHFEKLETENFYIYILL